MTIDDAIEELSAKVKGTRFDRLETIVSRFFVRSKKSGGSHAVYKTPWPGDPRINIQRAKGGKAKPVQVRQVIAALEALKTLREGE